MISNLDGSIQIGRPVSVQFGIISPEEIEAISKVNVKHHETLVNGFPRPEGLMDDRMGPVDRGTNCGTCECGHKDCIGHFGHVTFARPVFNYGFMQPILDTLRCVCPHCSRVLLSPRDKNYRKVALLSSRESRIKQLSIYCQKAKRCYWQPAKKGDKPEGCGEYIAVYKYLDNVKIEARFPKVYTDFANDVRFHVSPEQVRNIFSKIDPADYPILGFDEKYAKPQWMIWTVFPIPPPNMRAGGRTVPISRNGSRESEKTKKLIDIVKFNNILQQYVDDLERVKAENLRAWFHYEQQLTKFYGNLQSGSSKQLLRSLPNSESSTKQQQQIKASKKNQQQQVHHDSDLVSSSTGIGGLLTSPSESGIQEQQQLVTYIPEPKLKDTTKLEEDVSLRTHILQMHVSYYLDSKSVNKNQKVIKTSKKSKGAAQVLSHKEGLFRGHMMGKRDDFTARTVISPDPLLHIDEVGTPWSIGMILTRNVPVNRLNIANLTQMVMNGPNELFGAKAVILESGIRKDLSRGAKLEDVLPLRYGMRVERHMINGDVVSFNRQPSLHRMSYMGHKIRLLPYSTFRLNLSVVTPYNADFDGDEMNMQVDPSLESESELNDIMRSDRNFLSPQNGRPCMAVVQDTLLGACLLTRRDVFLNRAQIMQMLSFLKTWRYGRNKLPVPAILRPEPLWTGKQIVSCILPTLNHVHYCIDFPEYESTGKILGFPMEDLSPTDSKLVIRKGEILAGHLCKKTLGTANNSLVHIILKDHSNEMNKDFIEDLQKITRDYIGIRGFTIGNSDMPVQKGVSKHVKASLKVIEDLQKYWKKTRVPKDEYETRVNKLTNDARGNVAKDIMADPTSPGHPKGYPLNNNFRLITATAGSKGTKINPMQISVCVGQNTVEGKRIGNAFTNRVSPHTPQFDDRPIYTGFVWNCLMNGLTPLEYWNYTMAGREGTIDTSVKTANTGYLQRRLCKALEDVGVQYDSTIRNSYGTIILFSSGEDGFDGCRLEFQDYEPYKFASRDEFCNKYLWTTEQLQVILDNLQKSSLVDTKSNIKVPITTKDTQSIDGTSIERLRELTRVWIEMEEIRLLNDYDAMQNLNRSVYKTFTSPVNFKRHLENLPFEGTEAGVPVTAARIIRDVYELQERLWKNVPQIENPWDHKFAMLLRSHLCSKKILSRFWYQYRSHTPNNNNDDTSSTTGSTLSEMILVRGMGEKNWKWLLHTIEVNYVRGLAQPGDMVGPISGQAIGEPTTQMSVVYDTSVSLVNPSNGDIWKGPIGAFVDRFFPQTPYHSRSKNRNNRDINDLISRKKTTNPVKSLDASGTSLLCDIAPENWYILHVSVDEKCTWTRVIEVSRHPANGGLVKVTTRSGRTLTATLTHSFLTRSKDTQKVIQIKGSDLVVGDYLPVVRRWRKGGKMVAELHPNLFSDMPLKTEDWNEQDDVIPFTEQLVSKFQWSGFAKSNDSCPLSSTTRHYPSSTNNHQSHAVKRSTLKQVFNTNRKLLESYDRQELEQWKQAIDGDIYWDPIVKLEILSDSTENVYDFTVQGNQTFSISNGILVHNTLNVFHFVGVSEKNIPLGVPRLNEIINNANTTKNPSLTIYLKDSVRKGVLPPELLQSATLLPGLISDSFSKNGGIFDDPRNEYKLQESLDQFILQKVNFPSLANLALEIRSLVQSIVDIHRNQTSSTIPSDDINPDDSYTLETTPSTTLSKGQIQESPPFLESSTLPENIRERNKKEEENKDQKTRLDALLVKLGKQATSLSELAAVEDKRFVTKFANSLRQKFLKDFILYEEVVYDPDLYKTTIEEDAELVSLFSQMPDDPFASISLRGNTSNSRNSVNNTSKTEWTEYVIRMEMDRKSMIEHDITVDGIVRAFRKIWENNLHIQYSSEYSSRCLLRIRVISDKKQNTLPGEDYQLMMELLKYMKSSVHLSGIEGIRKTFTKQIISEDISSVLTSASKGNNNSINNRNEKEWVIETEGTNLREVLANEFVDTRRTHSNDIKEIISVFGIEAATRSIIREITQVLRFYDIYVDYRHPCLLANLMCNREKIMGMTRHGMNRTDFGPLNHASFEETSEILHKAARYWKVDNLRGISENLMLGMIPAIGTGKFSIFLDTERTPEDRKSCELDPEHLKKYEAFSDIVRKQVAATSTAISSNNTANPPPIGSNVVRNSANHKRNPLNRSKISGSYYKPGSYWNSYASSGTNNNNDPYYTSSFNHRGFNSYHTKQSRDKIFQDSTFSISSFGEESSASGYVPDELDLHMQRQSSSDKEDEDNTTTILSAYDSLLDDNRVPFEMKYDSGETIQDDNGQNVPTTSSIATASPSVNAVQKPSVIVVDDDAMMFE